MSAWRSTVSARSRHPVRLYALLLVVAAGAVGLPRVASAQARRVALITTEGPSKRKVELELSRAIKKSGAELVTPADYEAVAKKLFAVARTSEDVAAVAADMKLAVALSAKVRKTEAGWELVVTLRHGPTGKPSVKLRYPLHDARVDSATLKSISTDVPPAIETASAGPGEFEAPETPEAAPLPGEIGPANGEDTEKPLEAERQVEPGTKLPGRPAWAPFIDATVAFQLSGRYFDFDSAQNANFHSRDPTLGLRVDATFYPLAPLARGPGAGTNAAAGLGIGATYDMMFWQPSVPIVDAMGVASVDTYETAESRLEAGLRWHWNMFRAENNRPELLLQLQYGRHAFGIQKRQYVLDPRPRDIGPPDVTYSYVTVGAGLRLPLISRLAFFVMGNLHIPFDTGSLNTAEEWGSGSAIAFRVSGGGEVRVWRGLILRVTGYYEEFFLSFDQPPVIPNHATPPCPCGTTGGATDAYYGVTFGAGYVF